MYVLHLLAAYDERKQRILTSKNVQKNAFWIYVLVAILGIVTIATLSGCADSWTGSDGHGV